MGTESSAVDLLRELAARQGVFPEDADLEGVLGFLERILPALDELERRIPPEAAPAGLFLPEGEGG